MIGGLAEKSFEIPGLLFNWFELKLGSGLIKKKLIKVVFELIFKLIIFISKQYYRLN